ncbi:hypothetical protein PP7435_CHR2-1748 [Komagataella phaffii CBS 7435]|uniref:DASH complex subunit DAD3 n=1 Tax=Komagataella phaffii (strain ATCC 76273 / CBS 7435 / CECT 11047 / NRRL Y-11430 / Wegner 21-1) TaxID=981350 RepID=A0A1G4KPR2_KOMPC|nr:hypothetical protein BQ9382_C2-1920 [Komagataella phaffii CBS 7435]SCV12004.1 hypothetical protein PP7435_CHR2-1748 [Komagataella phaffii CBS 7435]
MSEVLKIDYSRQPQLTLLEANILQQYQRLALLLRRLSSEIARITAQPMSQLIDNLSGLEKKLSLVSTLFKGAVYSLFLQQENNEQRQHENHENY